MTRKTLPLLTAVALTLLVYLFWAPRGPGAETVPATAPRAARQFAGRVAGGAGATVRLYEDVAGGFVAEASAGDDGAFSLAWEPTATVDRRLLFVRAVGAERGSAATPADPRGTTLELQPWGALAGVVLDGAARPVAGARVGAAEAHGESGAEATTDAQGRFTLDLRIARGAPLEIVVSGRGHATVVERRFRAGDPILLRLRPASTLRFEVTGPQGAPVAGALVGARLPRLLRPFAPVAVTDPAGHAELAGVETRAELYRVEAEGHLPVSLLAAPHALAEVTVWPHREVRLTAWDPVREAGVDHVSFEFFLAQETNGWWGSSASRALREFPIRAGDGEGCYRIGLPRADVRCQIAARGYRETELTVGAARAEASVRLTPLRRPRPGRLLLEAEGLPPRFVAVVVATEGGWYREVELHDGRGEVEVPPSRELQVGSAGAADGFWLPRLDLRPFGAGEARRVQLGARRAVRLSVRVKPEVEGDALCLDLAHEGFREPRRAPLAGGRAQFWVRPLRQVRVTVRPAANYFEHSGEFMTGEKDFDFDAHLRPSAALRCTVRDAAAQPVPFARVRLWEPMLGGRLDLRVAPREGAADASGALYWPGLRTGETAFEVAAPGFRYQRFALERLKRGAELAREVVLERAGRVRGRVLDGAGRPVGGVWVRVLHPRVRGLATPGGGRLTLFDLVSSQEGDAATTADGRFEIADETPGAALVGLFPEDSDDLPNLAMPLPEGDGDLRLPGRAHVGIRAPGPIQGVYRILPGGRAVLVAIDPPMAPKPLPVFLPSGRNELFVRLRNGRWASIVLELTAGATVTPALQFRR